MDVFRESFTPINCVTKSINVATKKEDRKGIGNKNYKTKRTDTLYWSRVLFVFLIGLFWHQPRNNLYVETYINIVPTLEKFLSLPNP